MTAIFASVRKRSWIPRRSPTSVRTAWPRTRLHPRRARHHRLHPRRARHHRRHSFRHRRRHWFRHRRQPYHMRPGGRHPYLPHLSPDRRRLLPRQPDRLLRQRRPESTAAATRLLLHPNTTIRQRKPRSCASTRGCTPRTPEFEASFRRPARLPCWWSIDVGSNLLVADARSACGRCAQPDFKDAYVTQSRSQADARVACPNDWEGQPP